MTFTNIPIFVLIQLNRSESDSAMFHRNTPFLRNSMERTSLRLKKVKLLNTFFSSSFKFLIYRGPMQRVRVFRTISLVQPVLKPFSKERILFLFPSKNTLFRLSNTVTVDYLLSGDLNKHRNSKTWIYCHTIPILGRWGDHVVNRITHNALSWLKNRIFNESQWAI